MSRKRPTFRLTEKQFSQQIVDLAQLLGWEVYRTWLSWHSPEGYPDLCICRPPRVAYIEVKSEIGKMTPAQLKWKALLEQCPGVEYYLWRPKDWEEIKLVLRPKEEKWTGKRLCNE